MGKWIRETDCEGKKVTYKCDACGFPDGWHDYKLCPMCGDPKEIESEDDGIEWPEDLKVLCLRFDCIHSDGTGRCKIQNELTENDVHGVSCGRYVPEAYKNIGCHGCRCECQLRFRIQGLCRALYPL